MKITNLAIVFILITLPLFVHNNIKVDNQKKVFELKIHYDYALHTAVQDATKMLLMNEKQEKEARYDSSKFVNTNREKAIETYFNTLYINFEITDDPINQDVLKMYVPVLIVVDYDGYYVYVIEEYTNGSGEKEMKHVWLPKKPYAYVDNEGNSISFTLDDYVHVYDKNTNEWHKGLRADIYDKVTIPLLEEPDAFEQVRRVTIVQGIQSDVEYYINRHNTYATRYGLTYTFTVPTIRQEEWNDTIDDIGILSFIQGIPLGINHYNSYALSGTRMVKKEAVYGTEINGVKYAYRSDCSFSYPVSETFSNHKEAAENGYFQLSCKNK